MTRTYSRLVVVGVAVLTAALLIGVVMLLGPGSDTETAAGPLAASTDAPAPGTTPAIAPSEATTISAVPTFDRVPGGVGLQSQVGADGAEISVTVDSSADTAWVLPTCADTGPLPASTDTLTTVETGPEYARYWQVAVLPDVAGAEAVLAAVTAAVAGCGAQVESVATTGATDRAVLGDLGAGAASLLAVARPAGAAVSGDSEFRTYLGAVRVGNAVVLAAESAEFHDAPAPDDYGAQAVRADVAELLRALIPPVR